MQILEISLQKAVRRQRCLHLRCTYNIGLLSAVVNTKNTNVPKIIMDPQVFYIRCNLKAYDAIRSARYVAPGRSRSSDHNVDLPSSGVGGEIKYQKVKCKIVEARSGQEFTFDFALSLCSLPFAF